MYKDLRIISVDKNKRLVTYLLDVLSVCVSTTILFFAILYGIFATSFKYVDHKQNVKQYEDHYQLNLPSNLEYKDYETVIKRFYLEEYPEELLKDIQKTYPTISTIEHAYNVTVLSLPTEPTPTNYKTTYHQYVQNADGTFDVDVLAVEIPGMGGDNYRRNMRDIFYQTYSSLKSLLRDYNEDYNYLVTEITSQESLSRIIAGSLSVIVFYMIIPLFSKYDSTLFEKINDIGHVTRDDGFKEKKYKVLLRALIIFIIPLGGLVLFDKYSIILLVVLPLFIWLLMIIFSQDSIDLSDKFTFTRPFVISESEVFTSKGEEIVYERTEQDQTLEDPEYLKKLESVKTFDLSESRDEQIKETISNEKENIDERNTK